MLKDQKEQSYMIWVIISNPRTYHIKIFPRANNTQGPKLVPMKNFGASLKAQGSEGAKLLDMGDNFQSTHFPLKDFSTRDKHARRSEGGPNLAPVRNF